MIYSCYSTFYIADYVFLIWENPLLATYFWLYHLVTIIKNKKWYEWLFLAIEITILNELIQINYE